MDDAEELELDWHACDRSCFSSVKDYTRHMANKFEAEGYANFQGKAWVSLSLFDRVSIALPASEVAEMVAILQRALLDAECEARAAQATE